MRRSPLLDFMEEHYEILPPAPITGPFLIENSPWLAEPMHALCDPEIREVTMQLAAQGGKNLVSEGFISYSILHAPGNILFYGQTDEDAEMFATTRALRRARSIPILQNVWPTGGRAGLSAAKNNQVHLAHMSLEFLGISPANMEGKSAPYIICDEKHLNVWKGKGDAVKERCSAFWDHKIFNMSTAGEEGSEIDLDYQRGSMEDWHLGCPACHRPVRPVWSSEVQTIVWDAPPETWKIIHPEKGKWNFRELRKHVRFRCPHEGCGCEEKDSFPLKKEMNRLGTYLADNNDCSPDHRSFHVSQIAYPWKSWESLAEKWIHAMEQAKTGDLSNLRAFVIRSMGHTWKKQISNASSAVITGDYQIIDMVFFWELEKDRFATVDVQERGGRHFWVVIRAWAAGGPSRLVNAYRCESWDEVERRVEENKVKARRVGVDSRHATQEVKEQCAKMGWHYMVADETRAEYLWILPSGAKVMKPYMKSHWKDSGTNQGTKYADGLIFSKTWARKVLANRISGQGTEWGLPSDVKQLQFRGTAKIESSYLAQLNSWVEKEDKENKAGVKKLIWFQTNSDDHFRACEEMQLVLAAISGFFPSELVAEAKT